MLLKAGRPSPLAILRPNLHGPPLSAACMEQVRISYVPCIPVGYRGLAPMLPDTPEFPFQSLRLHLVAGKHTVKSSIERVTTTVSRGHGVDITTNVTHRLDIEVSKVRNISFGHAGFQRFHRPEKHQASRAWLRHTTTHQLSPTMCVLIFLFFAVWLY
jgi:hypothetical protein